MIGISEGWLVSDSTIIYAVKGYRPSPQGYYVVPKYYDGRCLKIQRCPREFSLYDEALGRNVCVIPQSRIAKVYHPMVKAYRHLFPASSNLMYVYELLYERLQGVSHIGLTGSIRIGCGSEASDLDILIYPYRGPDMVYDALRSLREEKIASPCNLRRIVDNYISKIKGYISLSHYIALMKEKLLEGCIRDVMYSARIIWPANDICSNGCIYISTYTYRGMLFHLDDYFPYTTPAVYGLEKEMLMMTWRIRYSELPEGSYEINGRLYYSKKGGYKVLVPDSGSITLLSPYTN